MRGEGKGGEGRGREGSVAESQKILKIDPGLRYVKTAIVCTCSSNNWESVEDRWVHAATGLASNELSFHSCNVLRDCQRGVPRENKK